MDAERWRRARALFEQLAESPAAEWEARLAAACPDDAGVRAEALALLRADAESTEPTGLASPPIAVEYAARCTESPGVDARRSPSAAAWLDSETAREPVAVEIQTRSALPPVAACPDGAVHRAHRGAVREP